MVTSLGVVHDWQMCYLAAHGGATLETLSEMAVMTAKNVVAGTRS